MPASDFAAMRYYLRRAQKRQTHAEQMALIEQAQACWPGAEAARNQLVEANLPLILRIIGKLRYRAHRRNANELGDLIQAGALGLMRAIERFDMTRGLAFSTYAYPWIRCYVNVEIQQTRSAGLYGRGVATRRANALRAEARLTAELHRDPTAAEVHEAVRNTSGAGSVELTERALGAGDMTTCLPDEQYRSNAGCNGGGRTSLGRDSRWAALSAGSEVQTVGALDRKRLAAKALALADGVLTDRQREVLRRRHGIGHYQEHTLAEIGAVLKLSRERVRQIEAQAIDTLRQHMGAE